MVLPVAAVVVVQIVLAGLPVLVVHSVVAVVLSVVAGMVVVLAEFASLEAIDAAKPNFVILGD